MVLLLSSPDRIRLIQDAKYQFRLANWSIQEEKIQGIDFSIKKNDFLFFIQCIDSGIKKISSNELLITQMSADVGDLKRRKSVRLVHIINFDFLNSSLNDLLAFDIIAFHIPDINSIDKICKFENVPANLTPRELALLQSNREGCLRVSRYYIDIKNIDDAIIWARHTVAADRAPASSYAFLLKLLVDHGYTNEAEKVSKTALSLAPENIGILTLSQKLAQQQKNTVSAEEFSRKIQFIKESPAYKFRQSFTKSKTEYKLPTIPLSSSSLSKWDLAAPKRWIKKLFS
ncbi:hypothetical protein ACELLULO517_28095 [Acidisoma cellulosilytica]|uniref:Tetratricopeptide repeat protein n=1 Tax=Acidisoma cellulosilyticum TaxID=2802395 RepID=A0A963Z779_9PROT|nr:hypothetical protein [Acidisoma cellulosilyticum]MCB8884107.1 hypothetical protein [Acidisoma cellulosilyticum]